MSDDSATPSLAGAPAATPDLSPHLTKFIEVLHSVPTFDTNYAHRNLLLDDSRGFGIEQYNGVAHLIAIVQRCVSDGRFRAERVDHLIDTAKLFAGPTELGARLEAWRTQLKQHKIVAPGEASHEQCEIERTSGGRKYVLLSWATALGAAVDPSPLRGVVPAGWRAEITCQRWATRAKRTPYGSGEPWSVRPPWVRTLHCVRAFFIQGEKHPEFVEEVHLVPPLQRAVSVVLFLALTGFAVAFFLLLTRVNGLVQVPWGSAAAFVAIVVALPPLKFLRTRIQDRWVSTRLGLTVGGTMIALVVWLLLPGALVAVRSGPDAIVCNEQAWPPRTWRVFLAGDANKLEQTTGTYPGGCKLPSSLLAGCPTFEQLQRESPDFDTLGIWFFRMPSYATKGPARQSSDTEFTSATPDNPQEKPVESCEQKPAGPGRVLQSCSDTPVSVSVRDRKESNPRPKTVNARGRDIVASEDVVEVYEAEIGNQLDTMELWTLGSAAGHPTENIAIRVGDRLIGTCAHPASDDLRWFPTWPATAVQGCTPPRVLEVTIDGRRLVARGPLGAQGQNLKHVAVRLGRRPPGRIKLYAGAFEQEADVLKQKQADVQSFASTWIVDVLERDALYVASLDNDPTPVRLCMKCGTAADLVASSRATQRPPPLCALYRETVTQVFDDQTGVFTGEASCGPSR
jgi:hypothetical protein